MAEEPEGRRGHGERGDGESLTQLRIWQIQAVRDVLFVASIVGVVWVGYALRAVTVPLLVALLLAYLFEPLVARLSARGMTRTQAVGGLLVGLTLVLAIFLVVTLPLIVGQLAQLVEDVKDGGLRAKIERLEQFVPDAYEPEFAQIVSLLPSGDAVEGAPITGDDAPSTVPLPPGALTEERVREIVAEALAASAEGRPLPVEEEGRNWLGIAKSGLDAIVEVIAMLIGLGLLAFLIPFYFFFFSVYYPDVVAFGRELIPVRKRGRAMELLAKMDFVVSGFVRGRIVISLIMGAMLAVGWALCDVPYALLIGFTTGIFCAVPYLGGIGIPVACGALFIERLGDPTHAADGGLWWVWVLVWPTAVFAIVQLVEGYVLTPLIAGKATNLDPVTILVAVLAGGSVLGVYGMLLAIPLAACARILISDVVLPRVREWTEGRARDPLPIERD